MIECEGVYVASVSASVLFCCWVCDVDDDVGGSLLLASSSSSSSSSSARACSQEIYMYKGRKLV
jgi:hypothetical protein